MSHLCRSFLVLSLLTSFTQLSPADEKPDSAENNSQETKAPETITVATEPLKIEVTVDGVFEASGATEVILRPESWSELRVLSAVEHGRRVKKGATLIKFDTQKIDLAIDSAVRAEASARLALRQAEAALQLAKKTVPQALAASRRSAKEAAENLDQFRKIGKAEAVKDMGYSLTSARNALAYQKEELDQLEKMYKADDLTEETEEIILTRARNRVKTYEYMLAKALLERDEFLKFGLQRRTVAIESQAEQAQVALTQAQTSLPASLTERTLALDGLKAGYDQAKQKLAQLRRDRKLLIVQAPKAGVVYYGKSSRGKWAEVSTMSSTLRQGGLAKPNTVLMTIVDDSRLAVRTAVAEKDLFQVAPGAPATVKPTAFPDSSLSGKLSQVATVPYTDGKFDARIDLKKDQQPRRLAAGMNCKAAITVYDNPKAILLPKSAVADSDQPKSGYVYVVSDKGKHKRNVRLGRTQGDKLQIVKGLKVGEKVLQANPDQETPAAKPADTTATKD